MKRSVEPARVRGAKRAFTTRNIDDADLRFLSTEARRPQSGDLVLARVAQVGNHTRLELTTGRKAALYTGDEIIVAYGDRYAPDQFEAEVPTDLGPCDLVAGGGVASRQLCRSARIKDATKIEPIGLFVDDNDAPVNVRSYGLMASQGRVLSRPLGIAVVGGSMNAGKTETAVSLVRSFTKAGFKVGAAKITGTGSGNDLWRLRDAGAHIAYDFTDAGRVSTYKASNEELARIARTLANALIDDGADALIFEIADGVFQNETRWLVSGGVMDELVDGYIYAAESAASAVVGADWIRSHARLIGVSGCVTMSPLATREAEAATGARCFTRDELRNAATAVQLHDEYATLPLAPAGLVAGSVAAGSVVAA